MWAVLLNCREELSYVGCPLISQASTCTFPLVQESGRKDALWAMIYEPISQVCNDGKLIVIHHRSKVGYTENRVDVGLE